VQATNDRSTSTAASASAAGLDRTVLPIHEPTPAVITELDARQAKAPPRFELQAPKGAPNELATRPRARGARSKE